MREKAYHKLGDYSPALACLAESLCVHTFSSVTSPPPSTSDIFNNMAEVASAPRAGQTAGGPLTVAPLV